MAIYLDNAATTRMDERVLTAMLPYLTEHYGNPSAIYRAGAVAKQAITKARGQVAELIGAKSSEIFFTSGGSEADNWALTGAFETYSEKGRHIITTKIEHHAVLHTCEALSRRGAEITYVDVDEKGFVSPEAIRAAIRPDTVLISVMTANNEIGTIEPIRRIGQIAHEHGILFHTDAVQAYGHIPIDVIADEIDLLSASAHKLNGPKGVGMLYIKSGIRFGSLLHGGAQERGRRAGTENVAGIVGFGEAARLAGLYRKERAQQETELRDYFMSQLQNALPKVRINGDRTHRLPNNVHILFPNMESESILIMLDQRQIYASGGSACTSGSIDPSHVLRAIGISDADAYGALRLTISHETTKEEIDRTVEALKEIVGQLCRFR